MVEKLAYVQYSFEIKYFYKRGKCLFYLKEKFKRKMGVST